MEVAGGKDQAHVEMRRLRRSIGMRQAELARLLGLSRESVVRIERGRVPRKRKQAIIAVWCERIRHGISSGS
jgi:DNA-binding XRE family transcriptional regulator